MFFSRIFSLKPEVRLVKKHWVSSRGLKSDVHQLSPYLQGLKLVCIPVGFGFFPSTVVPISLPSLHINHPGSIHPGFDGSRVKPWMNSEHLVILEKYSQFILSTTNCVWQFLVSTKTFVLFILFAPSHFQEVLFFFPYPTRCVWGVCLCNLYSKLALHTP